MSRFKKILRYLDEILQLEASVKAQLSHNRLRLMNWVPLGGMFVGLFISLFVLIDFYVSFFNVNRAEGQPEIVALGQLVAEGVVENVALFLVFGSIISPMFLGLAFGGFLLNLAPGLFRNIDSELIRSYRTKSLPFGMWMVFFFGLILAFGFLGIFYLADS